MPLDDRGILDALRAGRSFTTGGIEARDHESYEWSLEISCESGTFVVRNTILKGANPWTNEERFDEVGFLAYLDRDPSLRSSLATALGDG